METYGNIFEEEPIIVPTKEHTFLEDFIGKWAIEGENFDVSPNETNIEVKGIESYEWLSGGFFLVYKWERYIGSTNHQGLGIISHDHSNHTFEINNYDNMGYNRAYTIVHEGNSWKFSDQNERAVINFNADGNGFTENWEIVDEQGNWKPLCQLKAKRINS